MKSAIYRILRTSELAAVYRVYHRSYCTKDTVQKTQKVIHPYRMIHPWKSETEFTNSILKNVIYNADGIVVINKPYGIPIVNSKPKEDVPTKKNHKIVGEVNYSIQDIMPFLTKELDVPALIPCIGAEKYMSGLYVFGTSDNIYNQIVKARARAVAAKQFLKYWIITNRVPHSIEGSYHLAMALRHSKVGNKKPVILTQWAKNAAKKNEVKILNVKYKLLSNSTHNLSSLIELAVSTRKWHAIRLFASTMLYSPILGDNYHGSRVQEIMGTWIRVDPFAESCWELPKLNKQLLDLLGINESQQDIIPVHIHLRNIDLLSFGNKGNNITLEAPLIDPFNWTYRKLLFKNILDEVDCTNTEDKAKEVACA